MGKTDALMLTLSRWAPPVARLAISYTSGMVEKSPEKFSRQLDAEMATPDKVLHADAELRETVRAIFRETTRHGDTDALVPLHHAEHVTKRLPRAELTVLKDVGHLHSARRWRDFLTAAAAPVS
jgi:pimeloyl-ACP methyl ester carboxylesterase